MQSKSKLFCCFLMHSFMWSGQCLGKMVVNGGEANHGVGRTYLLEVVRRAGQELA